LHDQKRRNQRRHVTKQKEQEMKYVSFNQTESALFNLDSMREKLYVQKIDLEYSGKYIEADEIDKKIEEVEYLLGKMQSGRVTSKEWSRIQSIVSERKMQRYITCINSGMDERIAAGAFND